MYMYNVSTVACPLGSANLKVNVHFDRSCICSLVSSQWSSPRSTVSEIHGNVKGTFSSPLCEFMRKLNTLKCDLIQKKSNTPVCIPTPFDAIVKYYMG